MRIEVWYDYICPWCYLALDRARYLEEVHGAEVVWHPFELHPDWPATGMDAPRDERAGVLKALVERSDLRYSGRHTVTNSLAALALATALADDMWWPDLHRRLFEAYWADNRNLGDRSTLMELVAEFGVASAEAVKAIERGEPEVLASKQRALDLGISATPGWHFGNGVVFPGVHEPEVFDRIMNRLAEPTADDRQPTTEL